MDFKNPASRKLCLYDSSHLSLISFVTYHLKSSFLFLCYEAKTENGLFCWTRHFMLSQWNFVNEEFLYSVTACKQEYLAKYHDLFELEVPRKRNHVEDLQYLRKLLLIWDDLSIIRKHFCKISSAVGSFCCNMTLNNGHWRKDYKTFLKLKGEWTCALNKIVNTFNIYCDV